MSMDPSMLPSELLVSPQPLIGFVGLDTNNSTHKLVWDTFTANRKQERALIQFKLLSPMYEFPVPKPKRTNYEWFNPKGILKKNWMLKHLHVLPSIVIMFMEIEWNDPKWAEKQLQISNQIQQLKNSLQERNTRLAIVLLQKNSQSAANDDLLASERAANLTSNCEINAKCLFVLPYNDHLLGYAIRLESAFLELSQAYYIQMIKQIRLHRDQLSQAHQSLRVRHQFKLGFISEIRQDFSTALKHYTQAYIYLEEIRVVDSNCLEIKTIAGFINYKMCRLMFKLNVPRDSITQFKTHIEKFKDRGKPEIIFEHYAWCAVQFNYFAELFCEAIKTTALPALQTQNPGIYYQKAAEYVCKRREAYLKCCALNMSPSNESAVPAPTAYAALFSDFFGVRGGSKNTEPVSEQQIMALVQDLEKQFNHSAAIIVLLGQAMTQFKIYKCARFRKKLAIEMAEEYFKSGEYTKALTFNSLMLTEYREDKWFEIFSQILLKTLQSAYLAASVADFISCSIETLSPKVHLSLNERKNILQNLWKVFQNTAPLSQSQIAPELKQNWETALGNFKSLVTVDLDVILDLLECKISFQQDQIKFTDTVGLNLYIRSFSEVPIKLQEVSVILSSNKKSKVYKLVASSSKIFKWSTVTKTEELSDEKPARDFILEPGMCYKLNFTASQYQFMENVEIEINRVEFKMGNNNHALLVMQKGLNRAKTFQKYNPHQDYLENVSVIKSCYVIPTFHLSTQAIQKNQPMLVNEYFRIDTNITNNYDICLQNVGISINLPTNLQKKAFLTTDITSKTQKLNSMIQIDIGTLQIQSTTQISYYVVSLQEGNIELKQNLWYQTEDLSQILATKSEAVFLQSMDSPNFSPTDIQQDDRKENFESGYNHSINIEYLNDNLVKKIKEEIIIVPCMEEIKLSCKFYTLNHQPLLTRCFKDEDFLMRVNLEIKSPFHLDIVDVNFITDFNLHEKPFQDKNKILRENLTSGTKLEIHHMLQAKSITDQWVTKDKYKKVVVTDCQELFRPVVQKAIAEAPVKTEAVPLDDPFNVNSDDKLHKINYNNTLNTVKNIYNHVLDAVDLVNGNSTSKNGFFNCNFNILNKPETPSNIFGVYCIKWKKSGSNVVNESKFAISGIEVINPPINIYSYVDKFLYVREIFTLKITLKNPTKNIIHLQAIFNSADGFMFAGHRQLNITLLSYSSFDFCINLCPLKVGWQVMPELQLEYVHDGSTDENLLANEIKLQPSTNPKKQMQLQQQSLLSELVKRWTPKSVFVHPATRKLDIA